MRKSSSLFFYFDVQIYKNFWSTKRFVTFFSKFFATCHEEGAGKRLLGFTDLLFDDLQFTKRDAKQMTGPVVFNDGIYTVGLRQHRVETQCIASLQEEPTAKKACAFMGKGAHEIGTQKLTTPLAFNGEGYV